MESGEPLAKKSKKSLISDFIFEMEFQNLFSKHWQIPVAFKTDNLEIISHPYKLCKISNFLRTERIMDKIKDDLYYVKTRRNSVDLYQFEQSNDLKEVNKKYVKILYETFETDMRDWMERNTNLKLNKHISMSSNSYTDTDYLLCHDDRYSDSELGERKIAFILYLSKDWTREDGGALELFDTDEFGEPRNVVKSLVPEYNSLVFFEVTNKSYHQVAEVLSPDKSRWSISGWFYVSGQQKEKIIRPKKLLNYIEPQDTKPDLKHWISSSYLDEKIKKSIQKQIEFDSYTFLSDFLESSMYEKLSKELASDSIKWKKVGPADYQNFEVIDESSLPETLGKFCHLFKSCEFFKLLKDYTELDLESLNEFMKPKMTFQLQRWSKGCYTLINSEKNVDDMDHNVDIRSQSSNGNYSSDKNAVEEDTSLAKQSFKITCDTPPSEDSSDGFNKDSSSCLIIDDNVNKCSTSKSRLTKEEIEVLERRLSGESSDIADYMSHSSDHSDREQDFFDSDIGIMHQFESSDNEDNDAESDINGSLDVMIQFHTDVISEQDLTIDYVDVTKEDGALICVPAKKNHLCLVYKKQNHCRLHKYVNHYCNGYFYNFICTYYE